MPKNIIAKIKKLLSPNSTMRVWIIGAVVLLCVAGALYFYSYRGGSSGSAHHVKLTEDGFSPQTITIATGDTVVFTTNRGKPFWPASDLHPTHSIYPEFDPKQPIDPDQSWSFRFDKAGEWRFHDHLAPLFRGVILVRKGGKSIEKISTKNPCDTSATLTQCWKDRIDQASDERGLDAAFAVLAEAYAQDPSFASNCHGFTHSLGQEAYQRFKNNELATISPKTSYCGYGFYHGFMEGLLHDGKNVAEARQFCIHINQQLNHKTSVWTPCLHGIGHGVTDASDPTS